jgi:hypothetical protein
MPDCVLVIARGGEGISTPWAYGALDAKFGDFKAQGSESEARLARVVNAMEQVFGDIRFDRCPTTGTQMLAVREAVDAML